MIATIIFAVLIFVVAGCFVLREVFVRKDTGLTGKEYRSLSWPSQEIMREYHSLPEDNRPHGDMFSIVKSLDISHGADAATKHFTRWMAEGIRKTWACGQYHCGVFKQYHDLHESILKVKDALEAQRREFAIAAIGASDVKGTVDALNEEAKSIKQITTEVLR